MQLAHCGWPAIQALDKNTPVVFPIASLEQHGHHLPVFTDSMLLGEIVARAGDQLADRVLFAPLMWLGNSDHHLDFPGTLSAPPRAYLDLLGGLLGNFIQHGFRRLVFLNGHGGNDVPSRQAIFELRQQHRDRRDLLLLTVTYWQLGDPLLTPGHSFQQSQMGHACEWETSMVLRLAPHLVGDLKSLPTVEQAPGFGPAERGWITKDRTASGHIGSPQWATAEKGESLFRIYSGGVVDFLERVHRWDGESWNG